MPYYRTNNNYKTRYRKRYRRKPNNIKRDVALMKRRLYTIGKPEFKFRDGHVPDQSVADQGLFYALNAMPKGDQADQREGRQIRLKSVQIRCDVQMNSSEAHTQFRLLVLVDKQPNGAFPNYLDLWNIYGSVIPVVAMKNLDFRHRFTILRDVTIQLDQNSIREKMIKIYKKLNIVTTYNGDNNGTVGDIETNSLLVYVTSDNLLNQPTFNLSTRIRYIDN